MSLSASGRDSEGCRVRSQCRSSSELTKDVQKGTGRLNHAPNRRNAVNLRFLCIVAMLHRIIAPGVLVIARFT